MDQRVALVASGSQFLELAVLRGGGPRPRGPGGGGRRARPTPIRHAEDEQPLGGAVLLKVLACIALLLVFAGLFETLGFILSAALVGSCMAILYGARPIPAVVTASLLGIGLYWLFDRALDVPLPLGVLDFLPL
ncbi:tripartite tricarboxylate transporter TctB family protein [Pseudomonas aeruginosa]|uniref:tripartite tricarboxylate transporter TctB family protein n=1 Tax=Pseudomonas aeruginosa TaxID=287 RepID=UPI0021F1FF1C|nr:tripartite tricarboxylate transporter TctB family protein [Pseudomonas aeruginosa]